MSALLSLSLFFSTLFPHSVCVFCNEMETGKRKMYCVRKRGTQHCLTDVINKGKAFKEYADSCLRHIIIDESLHSKEDAEFLWHPL